MLPFRTFLVLCFAFRSMVSFENMIFGKSVRTVSRFIFGKWIFSCASTIYRKPVLHCIAFAPLSTISWPYLCGSISGFSILFLWPVCLFFCHTLDYYRFIVNLETGYYESPSFIFLFQYCAGYFGSFISVFVCWYMQINLLKFQNCAESIDQVGKTWRLINIEFSYPWMCYISSFFIYQSFVVFLK